MQPKTALPKLTLTKESLGLLDQADQALIHGGTFLPPTEYPTDCVGLSAVTRCNGCGSGSGRGATWPSCAV